MKIFRLTACIIFLELLCFRQAFSQVNSSDSTYLVSRINNLTDRYNEAIADEKHLFIGKEYLSYDKYYLKGHQFFKSDHDQAGEVY
ncbi:MAG: hypothetical protein M3Q05_10040, partial [Bacteroidota bacterium]|nr:hypothetical protein [Bacteroidota bacterium]